MDDGQSYVRTLILFAVLTVGYYKLQQRVLPYYGTAICSEAVDMSRRCEELLKEPDGKNSTGFLICKTDLEKLVQRCIISDVKFNAKECTPSETDSRIIFCKVYRNFKQERIMVTDELLVGYTRRRETPVKSTTKKVAVKVDGQEKTAQMTTFQNPRV